MNEVSKERIREILTQAREKMNDTGAHWIRGRLSRKKKVGMCYCSIGAIFATTSDVDERRAAIEALVLHGIDDYKLDPLDLIYSRYPGRGTVEMFNDDQRRIWPEVDKAFRKAARALR